MPSEFVTVDRCNVMSDRAELKARAEALAERVMGELQADAR